MKAMCFKFFKCNIIIYGINTVDTNINVAFIPSKTVTVRSEQSGGGGRNRP